MRATTPVIPEAALFESDHKLRHQPFFEFVAAHAEGDPAWRAGTAGLVVLRLVDAWIEDGRPAQSDDEWSVRSVRACIDEVDVGNPIRMLLGRIVDAMQSQDPDIYIVVTPLMAYAQALEYEAQWHLSADVYQTLLAHLHPVEDGDASIAAHLRLGQCHRNLQNLDEALDAFAAAADIGKSTGDLVAVLRARIGEATIAVVRGNIPLAEELLDATIAQATGPAMQDVRSRALHNRANVARRRGNFDLAVQLAYEALSQSHSPSEKDRILGDIAAIFIDLGVYSAARDAYLVLSATAQEQYVRWGAMLNLMEIAFRTGAETQFEHARRMLLGQTLPPLMRTYFELNQGEGYQRLGNAEKARAHLTRALELAHEFELHELVFDAETALANLGTAAPRPDVGRPVSLDLEEVAEEIRKMRELVGAG
jgi:tetratricopeptide (TPR) repeat protein